MKVLLIISKKNFFILLIAIFAILISSFITYNNPHGFYADAWQFSTNTFSYESDIYLHSSTVLNSSKIYTLLGLLKINLLDDRFGFMYHVGCSAISFLFVYKIILKFISPEDKIGALSIVLTLLFFDNIVLDLVRGGVIFTHPVTPSELVHALQFSLLWFALNNSWIIVGIISFIMIVTAIKIAWFPVAVVVIYWVFCNKNIIRSSLWLFFPVAGALLITSSNNYSFADPTINLDLFKFVVQRNDLEDAPHLQTTYRIVGLALSFILFKKMVEAYSSGPFKNMALIILYTSLGMILIGGMYAKFGSYFYPDPRYLLLSPVRSLAIYQFTFGILLFNGFLNKKYSILTAIIVILLLTGLYLKNGSLVIGIPPSFFFFLLALLIYQILFYEYQLYNYKKFIESSRSHLILAGFLLISSFPYTVDVIKKIDSINWDSYKKIHKFNVGIKDDFKLVNFGIALRGCADFKILALTGTEESLPNLNSFTFSSITGKSKYLGDSAHFYLSLDMLKEDGRRRLLVKELIEYLSQNAPLRPETVSALSADSVLVVAPSEWIEKLIPFSHGIEKIIFEGSGLGINFGVDVNKLSCLKATP